MPLVTFQRPGRDTPVHISPEYVWAIRDAVQTPNVVIISMSDGRGFVVQGSYGQVKGQFPGLIEFNRAVGNPHEMVEGEDDGIGAETQMKLAVNPRFASALLASQDMPGKAVLRGPDGRGLLLDATVDEVYERLQGGGGFAQIADQSQDSGATAHH